MGSSKCAGATAGGVDSGRPGANMLNTCCATVVPALLLLLLLAQPSASQEGAKVKFGARVEQAKSKCSGGGAKCQFGYTFKEESGRERNVFFVAPRDEEEDEEEGKERESARKTPPRQSQRLPPPEATYFEMGREIGKRLRFDPRKRQQKDRASEVAKTQQKDRASSVAKTQQKVRTSSAVAKTQTPPTARTIGPRPAKFPTKPPTAREQPVPITIGGVSIVIPDFGLKQPASTSAQKASPKPSRRPVGARTRRPRPRISPSRFSTKRPAITPVQRTTTPSPFTSTLSSFEELTSTVDDFSNTRGGGGRGFARGFVRSRVVTKAPSAEVSSSSSRTTVRGGKRGRGRTRARQRGSSERRNKPTTTIQDEQSSVENLVEPELSGGINLDPPANELRGCPGNLEGCVTACIPLEDVYVYSACVVECGKRCAEGDD